VNWVRISAIRANLLNASFANNSKVILLAFGEAEGEVRAVAGYRYLESLCSGKFIYVDDLVTLERDRSRGFGGQLLEWLVEQARAQNCQQLELDSGVQRFEAHRFCFLNRMKIASYHFSIKTKTEKLEMS